MVQKCVVCQATRDLLNGISLHALPADPVVRKQWILWIGREKIPQAAVLCSGHFSPECFEEEDFPLTQLKLSCGINSARKLKKGAIPTLRSKGSISQKRQHEDNGYSAMNKIKAFKLTQFGEQVVIKEVDPTYSQEEMPSNFSSWKTISTQTDVSLICEIPKPKNFCKYYSKGCQTYESQKKPNLERSCIYITNYAPIEVRNKGTRTTKKLEQCTCPLKKCLGHKKSHCNTCIERTDIQVESPPLNDMGFPLKLEGPSWTAEHPS